MIDPKNAPGGTIFFRGYINLSLKRHDLPRQVIIGRICVGQPNSVAITGNPYAVSFMLDMGGSGIINNTEFINNIDNFLQTIQLYCPYT